MHGAFGLVCALPGGAAHTFEACNLTRTARVQCTDCIQPCDSELSKCSVRDSALRLASIPGAAAQSREQATVVLRFDLARSLSCLSDTTANVDFFFFREAILMMELPRRHAASLERAAGSHPIRVLSMGGGRGRGLVQMICSSSGLPRGSVWQMRRLWLAAHQTPLACASIPWYQSCLVCGKRQWGLEQGSLPKWCRDIRSKV